MDDQAGVGVAEHLYDVHIVIRKLVSFYAVAKFILFSPLLFRQTKFLIFNFLLLPLWFVFATFLFGGKISSSIPSLKRIGIVAALSLVRAKIESSSWLPSTSSIQDPEHQKPCIFLCLCRSLGLFLSAIQIGLIAMITFK